MRGVTARSLYEGNFEKPKTLRQPDYPQVTKNKKELNKILRAIPSKEADKIRGPLLAWLCLQSGMILGYKARLGEK